MDRALAYVHARRLVCAAQMRLVRPLWPTDNVSADYIYMRASSDTRALSERSVAPPAPRGGGPAPPDGVPWPQCPSACCQARNCRSGPDPSLFSVDTEAGSI